jgi:hypothetical protein
MKLICTLRCRKSFPEADSAASLQLEADRLEIGDANPSGVCWTGCADPIKRESLPVCR